MQFCCVCFYDFLYKMIADEAIDFIDYVSSYRKKQVKKRLLEILQTEHAADGVDVALNLTFLNNEHRAVLPEENLFYNPSCQLIGYSGIQNVTEHSTLNEVNYAT